MSDYLGEQNGVSPRNTRTKLKLPMWYFKYRKYLVPAIVIAVVVYFVSLR